MSAVKELKFTLTKLSHRTDIIIAIVFIVIFAFLVLGPLIQIIYTSLTYQSNDLRVVRDAEVGQFTLYHYLRVFTGRLSRSLFFKPFINSLLVGGGVTLLAWVLVRTDVPFKRFFNSVIVIPYMMPSWVLALAWLLIFKNDRIAGEKGMIASLFGITPPDWFSYGIFPIIICLGLHYYAYSFLLVSGALRTVDSELSGGQQQRVAVARMIAAEPTIFLMDEPLSNLDAMLRVDMRAELKHLHHELGATTVYVTHDQVEALTLSDKIVVMDQGLLKQLGTPEEIYKKPADLFVARFVGSPRINVIEGRIVTEAGRQYFHSGSLKSPVAPSLPVVADSVLATIRPEDVGISAGKKKGWLETKVYSVLPAGSETIITVQSGSLSLSVKINGFTAIKMDDLLWLNFDPEKMNYYDIETERLIQA